MEKLTEQQVFEIKYENDGVSHKDLCEKYGISRWCIIDIRKGRSWQHVGSGLPRAKRSVSDETKQKISEYHQGSKSPKTKLTEQEVFEIKFGHKYLKQREIAELYGVSRVVIADIRINKTWKHVVSDLPITKRLKHLCDCLGNY